MFISKKKTKTKNIFNNFLKNKHENEGNSLRGSDLRDREGTQRAKCELSINTLNSIYIIKREKTSQGDSKK